jgi:hypothetical protein
MRRGGCGHRRDARGVQRALPVAAGQCRQGGDDGLRAGPAGPGYRFSTTLVTDGTRSTVASTAISGLSGAATRCSIPTRWTPWSATWPKAASARSRARSGSPRCACRHRPDRPSAVAACGLQPVRLGAEPQLQPRVLRMGARGRGLHGAHGRAVGQPFADGDGLAHDDRAAGLSRSIRSTGPRRGTSGPWRSALGNGGGRWLPVRRPPAYLAEVFQMLARVHGITLDAPVFPKAPRPMRRSGGA